MRMKNDATRGSASQRSNKLCSMDAFWRIILKILADLRAWFMGMPEGSPFTWSADVTAQDGSC